MARLGRIELVRTLNSLIENERAQGRKLIADGQRGGYLLGLSDGRMSGYQLVLGLLGSSDMTMSGIVTGIEESAEAGIVQSMMKSWAEKKEG